MAGGPGAPEGEGPVGIGAIEFPGSAHASGEVPFMMLARRGAFDAEAAGDGGGGALGIAMDGRAPPGASVGACGRGTVGAAPGAGVAICGGGAAAGIPTPEAGACGGGIGGGAPLGEDPEGSAAVLSPAPGSAHAFGSPWSARAKRGADICEGPDGVPPGAGVGREGIAFWSSAPGDGGEAAAGEAPGVAPGESGAGAAAPGPPSMDDHASACLC